MSTHTERWWLLAPLHRGLLLLAIVLLAACGQSSPGAEVPAAPAEQAATEEEVTYNVVLAASELEVGQSRLPLGIIKNGTPVNDPALAPQLRFFYLDGEDSTQVEDEAEAVYRGEGLPLAIYVAYPNLDRAGAWGVEVTIPQADGPPQTSNIRIEVQEETLTPAIGSPAIPSETLTSSDVPSLDQLTTDANPDADLYQMTVAEAIAADEPFLVTFSTPGYCQTAVCAPNLEVVKQLKDDFAGQINFLHVEVYPYPFSESFQAHKTVSAMGEWNLRTEPWTFLVDEAGIIQAKYEGGLTFEELEPALQQLAANEPIEPVAAQARRNT